MLVAVEDYRSAMADASHPSRTIRCNNQRAFLYAPALLGDTHDANDFELYTGMKKGSYNIQRWGSDDEEDEGWAR